MLTIAHISDLHVGSRPEALRRAERVMEHLVGMSPLPAVLLVTGDVADHGDVAEYVAARDLLRRWDGPVLVGTGNHDVRGPFGRVLLGEERDGPLDQALQVGEHRLLMLDSLVPAVDGWRIDHGELAPQTLDWLDRELSASQAPTFVCFHHPATTVNIELADRIQLRNGADLEPVLRRHPHVQAVLVGHNHTMCATTFAGRPMLVGGGVASTVTLDGELLNHLWLEAPPSLAFHIVDDTGRLTTHWRALG